MAGSPVWKVYRGGRYVAACKDIEDAFAIISVTGGRIKYDHKKTVFIDETDNPNNDMSYDAVVELVHDRMGW